MASPASGVCLTLALAGSVVALAASPGAASAALTLSSASIDGVTSTSSPPGGVLEARVSGKATAGDRWEATQYRFGGNPRTCVNTQDSSGNKTVEFNVTAPGDPGNYDAGFTARGTDGARVRRAPRKCCRTPSASPLRHRTPILQSAAAST